MWYMIKSFDKSSASGRLSDITERREGRVGCGLSGLGLELGHSHSPLL